MRSGARAITSTEPGKTSNRTLYRLTEKGLRAVREWARTPARLTPLKSEPLVRLLLADLVGEEATRKSLGALREEIDGLFERLDETEASAELLPHRQKYLLLVTGFLRRLLELHAELVDEVERELRSKRSAAPTTR